MGLRFLAAALVAAIGMTTSASANTINFYNDASTNSVLRFSVSCSLGCQAALFNGTPTGFSSTKGDLTDTPNGAGANLAFVNSATGQSFSSGVETPRGGFEKLVFSTSAEYISLKVGSAGPSSPDFALIWNTGGAGNILTFTKLITGRRSGTGLSNTREYGQVSPVPLPAAGWLLVAGLGGLAAMGRKRKVA